jgi:hypothetical protein
MLVLLAPLYLGWACDIDGWCAEVRNSNLMQMRNWGRYVGTRYRNFANLVWVIGGDTDPVANGVAAKVREFVAGLQETDSVHIITAHNGPEQSAVTPWPNERWLTLNATYTYDYTYNDAATEWARVPFKPFFLMESAYENEHGSTAVRLRSQAYWSVLSGGLAGHLFGNCEIWGFSWGYCEMPWQPQLNSAGSRTLPLVGRLFRSRAFERLVPDTTGQVLLAGGQAGSTRATAARTDDGATIIVYLPTRRTVTIDMARVAGTLAAAWWFDPRTGTSTPVGTFPTSGPVDFTPPDTNDWVLVVDDAARRFPPPGLTP